MNSLIHQTSREILEEFAALLKEFDLRIPCGTNNPSSGNQSEFLHGEAYEVLHESIHQKLVHLSKCQSI
jgi:hypothetical protein